MPEITFHRFHRYDLLAHAMQSSDQRKPAEPILHEASRVLQRGGAVFVVGRLPADGSRGEQVLPPARIPQDGWQSPRYQDQWGVMLGRFLRINAGSISEITSRATGPISDYENLSIVVARGWRNDNQRSETGGDNAAANE